MNGRTSSVAAALAAGYAALASQANLLDAINVFPVADGDTGANLRASLKPLEEPHKFDSKGARIEALIRSACGNSGNIAAAFFSELAQAETADELREQAENGAVKARQAVAEPKAGTMLDVFALFPALLRDNPLDAAHCPALLAALANKICEGAVLLPQLRAAGVADAGAVAMYIFFTGFFRNLTGDASAEMPLAVAFPDLLQVADSYQPATATGFCIDALLDASDSLLAPEALAALGDSLVMLPEGNRLKLHVHSDDPAALKVRLGQMCKIVSWTESPLTGSLHSPLNSPLNSPPSGPLHGLPHDLPSGLPSDLPSGPLAGPLSGGEDSSLSNPAPVRVITDAAGSLPRSLAEKEDIILFESLIVMAGQAYAEGEVAPTELYQRMRMDEKVSTAQAARVDWEERLIKCRRTGPSLYLAVGSAYTGNYAAAIAWQKKNPAGTGAGSALMIVDSGAASGRLALMAIFTARYAAQAASVESVAAYARLCDASCHEFLFIDTLRFLVAGGRVSKAGGFFGNVFNLKPIISPMPDGVRKLGLVRSRDGQLVFLKARLTERRTKEEETRQPLVLLQYTDNEEWLRATLPPLIKSFYPRAEIHIVPLSLTTGAHVGPGSWSVALGCPPPASPTAREAARP